jgi:hypothetical protein
VAHWAPVPKHAPLGAEGCEQKHLALPESALVSSVYSFHEIYLWLKVLWTHEKAALWGGAMKVRPETLFIRLVSICVCISVLATSGWPQIKTHCVELGGGSQMCLNSNGEVDWLECDVRSCSYSWGPAVPQNLNILDHAIAEETEFVAAFHNPGDSARATLAGKLKAALADLELFKTDLRAAIKRVQAPRPVTSTPARHRLCTKPSRGKAAIEIGLSTAN